MNNVKYLRQKPTLRKQKGMALIIAMMILPLLLALGVLLMNNSFLGLKVIDTRVMQNESNMVLLGSANELIEDVDSPTTFANVEEGDELTSEKFDNSTATVQLLGESACKRSLNASGSSIQCKYIQVDFQHSYGRSIDADNKWAENTLSVGVEQPIFAE